MRFDTSEYFYTGYEPTARFELSRDLDETEYLMVEWPDSDLLQRRAQRLRGEVEQAMLDFGGQTWK
jgi:hypothetical protein